MTYSFAECLILGRPIPDLLPDDEEDSLAEGLEETCAFPAQASGPTLVFDDMEI